jgi:hypothetical protein
MKMARTKRNIRDLVQKSVVASTSVAIAAEIVIVRGAKAKAMMKILMVRRTESHPVGTEIVIEDLAAVTVAIATAEVVAAVVRIAIVGVVGIEISEGTEADVIGIEIVVVHAARVLTGMNVVVVNLGSVIAAKNVETNVLDNVKLNKSVKKRKIKLLVRLHFVM